MNRNLRLTMSDKVPSKAHPPNVSSKQATILVKEVLTELMAAFQ